jgi:HEAT repeat protein
MKINKLRFLWWTNRLQRATSLSKHKVVCKACGKLADLKNKHAIPFLQEMLANTHNSETILIACEALTKLGNYETLNTVAEYLNDSDSNMVMFACHILGKSGRKEEKLIYSLFEKLCDNSKYSEYPYSEYSKFILLEKIRPLQTVSYAAYTSLVNLGMGSLAKSVYDAIYGKEKLICEETVKAVIDFMQHFKNEEYRSFIHDFNPLWNFANKSFTKNASCSNIYKEKALTDGHFDTFFITQKWMKDIAGSIDDFLKKYPSHYEQYVSFLLNCLKQENLRQKKDLAIEVCRLLGNFRIKQAVNPIINCMEYFYYDSDDYSADVRKQGCITLEKIGDKKAVSYLMKYLSDPNEELRKAAVSSIGALGDYDTVENLIFCLGRGKWSLHLDKFYFLKNYTCREPLKYYGEGVFFNHKNLRKSAYDLLQKLGEGVLAKAILDVIEGEEWIEGLETLLDFYAKGDKRAGIALCTFLASGSQLDIPPDVRKRLCIALGELGDKRATEFVLHEFLYFSGEYQQREELESLHYNNELHQRKELGEALIKLGDKSIIEPIFNRLIRLLHYWPHGGKDGILKEIIVVWDMLDQLLEKFEKDYYDFDWSDIFNILQYNLSSFIEIFFEKKQTLKYFIYVLMTELPKNYYRKKTLEILGKDELISLLIRLSNKDAKEIDKFTATDELISLIKKGDHRIIPALIYISTGWDIYKSEYFEVLIEYTDICDKFEELVKILRIDNYELRWKACEALGKLGNSNAIEPLMSRLDDKSELVRDAAYLAVVKIAGEDSQEQLLAKAIHDICDKDNSIKQTMEYVCALGSIYESDPLFPDDMRAIEPLMNNLDSDSKLLRDVISLSFSNTFLSHINKNTYLSHINNKFIVERFLSTLGSESDSERVRDVAYKAIIAITDKKIERLSLREERKKKRKNEVAAILDHFVQAKENQKKENIIKTVSILENFAKKGNIYALNTLISHLSIQGGRLNVNDWLNQLEFGKKMREFNYYILNSSDRPCYYGKDFLFSLRNISKSKFNKISFPSLHAFQRLDDKTIEFLAEGLIDSITYYFFLRWPCYYYSSGSSDLCFIHWFKYWDNEKFRQPDNYFLKFMVICTILGISGNPSAIPSLLTCLITIVRRGGIYIPSNFSKPNVTPPLFKAGLLVLSVLDILGAWNLGKLAVEIFYGTTGDMYIPAIDLEVYIPAIGLEDIYKEEELSKLKDKRLTEAIVRFLSKANEKEFINVRYSICKAFKLLGEEELSEAIQNFKLVKDAKDDDIQYSAYYDYRYLVRNLQDIFYNNN